MTMYYQPIPEDTVPEITETGKKYGSIDELLAETRPMIGENNEGSGYAPAYASAYSPVIREPGFYGGFYERSDLTNFILAIDMPITPFGDVGFYGVTSNMAFAQ